MPPSFHSALDIYAEAPEDGRMGRATPERPEPERGVDRHLLGAAVAYAGAGVLGSFIAIVEDIPGEPLGFGLSLPVPWALLMGWGAGVAAPWPMPVTALVCAMRTRRGGRSAGIGELCAVIGAATIVGTAVEPVSRHPERWSGATRAAIACNLTAAIGLCIAGLRHRKDAATQAT